MAVESTVLDLIDRALIGLLRSDGRMTFRELGDEVGLGPTATADRVKRLRTLGVLRRFTAVVDPTALGIGLEAFVDVQLENDADPAAFEEALGATVEVQGAAHVTGAFDYTIRLACPDVATLDRLLRAWKSEHGMAQSSTRIVLREIDLTGR